MSPEEKAFNKLKVLQALDVVIPVKLFDLGNDCKKCMRGDKEKCEVAPPKKMFDVLISCNEGFYNDVFCTDWMPK